jgi:spoIIIJ-associated protein
MAEETGADPLEAEGVGETTGEARWAALRELERRAPDLDRDAVEYVVLSEGTRGLMGLGREPARVLARAVRPAAPAPASEEPVPAPPPADPAAPVGEEAARAREVVERIAHAIADDLRVDVSDDGERILVVASGPSVSLLIGRHGHTIDAIQHLVSAILYPAPATRREVVIDAQGYRARRERSLRELAQRAADDAVRERCPMELDAMSSAERKVIHLALADRDDVETSSEGREPARYVVITPLERS